MQRKLPPDSAHGCAIRIWWKPDCSQLGAIVAKIAFHRHKPNNQAMVSEYTSMLLQMPDCSLPQSPDAAMAEHLSHTVEYLTSPAQYAVVRFPDNQRIHTCAGIALRSVTSMRKYCTV